MKNSTIQEAREWNESQGKLYTARSPKVQKSKSVRSPRRPPKSAVVRANSVFYSVLVVMWRQYDVAFLSTFILLLFLRIYQNLSTDFPISFILIITTRGVHHHSPLATSLSLLFVRWTREGLLTRRSVHCLIWIVVPSSLDPFSLAISPIDPDRHCSVLTFRLVILLIDSDRHCSVQALACTRNL